MDQSVQAAKIYDAIADRYLAEFGLPAAHLNELVKLLRHGTVLDVGCGPGTSTAYLAKKGLDATGIDLSSAMIRLAKQEHPGLRFKVADMRRIRPAAGSLDGIVASFSLIHLPKTDVPPVLATFHRALRKEGVLFVAIQEGKSDEIVIPEPFLPSKRIFLNIHSREEMERLLREAGFRIVKRYIQPARNGKEFNFNKCVFIAQKP